MKINGFQGFAEGWFQKGGFGGCSLDPPNWNEGTRTGTTVPKAGARVQKKRNDGTKNRNEGTKKQNDGTKNRNEGTICQHKPFLQNRPNLFPLETLTQTNEN